MAGTGPQKYPGANTTHWYQSTFGGSLMEVNVCVLHTTEGTTLPSYGGGGSAPNLTAVPNWSAKRLDWFQHFDIDRSSRALENKSGGVETNTLNVVQVELVGTCDPAAHKKWSAPHIFWPEAPEWALRDLAEFLAWLNENHGVPLVGPKTWLPYPDSYGNSTARMTNAQWNSFEGICGHQHVAENAHGDPGALDFTRLIAMAKGESPEEDTLAGLTKQDIYDAVWATDKVAAPADASDIKTNPTWQAQSYLKDTNQRVRKLQTTVTAQQATITELAKTVATLATNAQAIDPDALVARIKGALENVTIHLDATP